MAQRGETRVTASPEPGGERALTAAPDPVPEHLRRLGKVPGFGLWLTEPVRGAADAALLVAATPWLAAARNGDGHGVLVLPGLLADDRSTKPLRAYLKRRGYYVRGWRLGRNIGPSAAILDGLPGGLEALADRTGGTVDVIGWSMGGIFARTLARDHPDLVRQVITLGSPFGVAHGHRTRADRTYDRLAPLHAHEHERLPVRSSLAEPLAVPSTSVYSRLDGIVSWRACLTEAGDTTQNVEVRCSHLGYGFDPATLWVVADRLSQSEGRWERFDPPRALRTFYGRVS
ncbi:MAG TPA: alpha/beta hydrolase [Dermatophilaceae bacterium]|nr:alpha/beta hydrolase [Dermatophilaceae bacterium]